MLNRLLSTITCIRFIDAARTYQWIIRENMPDDMAPEDARLEAMKSPQVRAARARFRQELIHVMIWDAVLVGLVLWYFVL